MYKKFILTSPLIVSVLLLNASVVLAQTGDPSSGLVSPPPSSGGSSAQPSGSSFQSPPFNQQRSPTPQGGQMPSSSNGVGGFDANRSGQGSGGIQGGPQGQFQTDPNRPGMNTQMSPQFNGQNGGQNQNGPQFRGQPGQSQDGQRDAGISSQDQQKQQEQQQARMLKSAQNGLAQMQKMITGMEKRMASIEKKGGIIPATLKSSIGQAKDLMSKAQGASTMEEFQSAGLEDMRDLMETINDEMQKAEMSTQFPAMLKQANRALVQQQKALAAAQKKAASLKVSVDSLLASWQKAVDAMSEGISKAQQSSQSGNTEDAVGALKDNVFDAMQTIGDYRQTFEMIANSQKMLASATRELASMEKKIASLKKQGKDTSDAETALTNAKAKIQAVKDAIVQSGIDPDALISTIQDAQDAKEELYSAMYDLTGQAQYNQQTQQQTVPGLNTQQFQAPPGMQQFFGGFGQQQHQGENGQGGPQQHPGTSGNSGGFQRPSDSQDGHSGNQGGGSGQAPGTQGGGLPFFGPQSLNTITASSSQMTSVLESIRKQIAELEARIKEKTR